MQTLQDFYKVYTTSLSSGTVWLCIVVLAVIALIPDLIIRVTRDTANQATESTTRRVGKYHVVLTLVVPALSLEARRLSHCRTCYIICEHSILHKCVMCFTLSNQYIHYHSVFYNCVVFHYII